MKDNYNLHLEKCKLLISDSSTMIIGIDVSRLKHDVCFGTKDKVYCRKYSFTNDLIGFIKFEEKIKLLCEEHKLKSVLIGMEPTSIYWCALYEYLKSKDLIVCLLDPISVFHNRKTLKRDNGKSDLKDAYAIFDLMSQKKFYFTTDDDLNTFSTKLVLKNWMNAQRLITCTKSRTRSFLSLVFPELENEVSEIATKKILTFLNKFPTPATIIKLSEDDFLNECIEELKGYKPVELKKIYRFAKDSIGVDLPNETGNLIVHKHINDLSNQLEEENIWFQKSYKIVSSDPGYQRLKKINGLGDKIITGLMLSLGNYNAFANATQITKLAGLNLVDKTSGSSVNSPSHISHQGNHNLRYWAYHGALHVIKHPGPFKDLFDRKKKKSSSNGSGKRALIAVSDKLVRVVWAILKKGTDFDTDHNNNDKDKK